VNLVTKESNEVSIAKVDEIICMIKGNEAKAITDANVEEIDFVACYNSYHAWKNKCYNSNFQQPYPNPVGAHNAYNGENCNVNRQS
jgi:hypothetical protein